MLFVCHLTIAQVDTNFYFMDFVPDRYVLNDQDTLFIDIDGDGDKDAKFYYRSVSTGWQANLGTCEVDDYARLVDTNETRLLTDTSLHYGQGAGFVNNDKRYFIYRTTIQGNNYYGWILYYREQIISSYKKLYVDKYAFCKIPNYGIRVGQTSVSQSTGVLESKGANDMLEVVSNNGQLALLASRVISKVELYDELGRLVHQQDGEGINVVVLSKLAPGTLYMARVTLDNGAVLHRKLWVED